MVDKKYFTKKFCWLNEFYFVNISNLFLIVLDFSYSEKLFFFLTVGNEHLSPKVFIPFLCFCHSLEKSSHEMIKTKLLASNNLQVLYVHCIKLYMHLI
jgi:hypothetical protein